MEISLQIANELQVTQQQIEATIKLIEEGATIPFIARYRKEVTGGLDDTQLREFESRFLYLTDLEARKKTILKSIQEQNKLTPELEQKINACLVKSDLEDLYLPFKPKRNTKAAQAKEAGLEPLAFKLFESTDLSLNLEAECQPFFTEKYSTPKLVLEGCLYILMDRFAEDADLLKRLKEYLLGQAHFTCKVVEGQEEAGEKYQNYFDASYEISKTNSHNMLAMLRGRKEKFLNLSLETNLRQASVNPPQEIIERFVLELYPQLDLVTPCELNTWRNQVLTWTWKVKLFSSLETEMIAVRREDAEQVAIDVFAKNLRALLLNAPVKPQVVVGLDPGVRTGIKLAVVDSTSKLLETTVLSAFKNDREKEVKRLGDIIVKHGATLVVVGNGTNSRDTQLLAKEAIKARNLQDSVTAMVVSEAGASVYSASDLATKEFPELEASERGAISIARRVQDPLAELVKIPPRSIGVGQYQHDVNPLELDRRLNNVVEDCVNFVGVDVNTASVVLLERVSGIKKNIATKIVEYRDTNGRFKNRKELLKVSGLGPKAFEQCAGFLRVVDGDNVLDNSAVHPESYGVVERMAQECGVAIEELIGNRGLIRKLKPENFVTETTGLLTVNDIIDSLEKPGRDPRGEYQVVQFKDGVEDIKDLQVGMILEGVVTSVTNFGAFVDIGVHQDGLVHNTDISPRYISNIYSVLSPQEHIKVMVKSVELERNRISLTMVFPEQPKAQCRPLSAEELEARKKRREGKKAGKAPAENHKAPARKPRAEEQPRRERKEQAPREQARKPERKEFKKPQRQEKPVNLFNSALRDKLGALFNK